MFKGCKNILIAHAGNNNIMRVMGDGRTNSTRLHPQAADKSFTNMPGCLVALDDDNFHHIIFNIRLNKAILNMGRVVRFSGDNLPRNNVNNPDGFARGRNLQLSGMKIIRIHG